MQRKFSAHRGVSALMPENSLPAFAAALALGADEIEFDVRITKDNQLIVSHDEYLERISDGKGTISQYTLDELKKMNIGIKNDWNVPFCTPEEVFDTLANKMVFNIHIKEHGEEGFLIKELVKLARRYKAEDNIYFSASPDVLEWAKEIAPHIQRNAIQLPNDSIEIYEMAKKYECSRVQFWLGMFDENLINRLHSEGISCNLFYADCFSDYDRYFAMGVDTLLTNRMDLAARYKMQFDK